jgi:hypothetical protein
VLEVIETVKRVSGTDFKVELDGAFALKLSGGEKYGELPALQSSNICGHRPLIESGRRISRRSSTYWQSRSAARRMPLVVPELLSSVQ